MDFTRMDSIAIYVFEKFEIADVLNLNESNEGVWSCSVDGPITSNVMQAALELKEEAEMYFEGFYEVELKGNIISLSRRECDIWIGDPLGMNKMVEDFFSALAV